VSGSAIWLVVLGALGLAHPFVSRSQSKTVRWVFLGVQALLGLNAVLWGLWALIDSVVQLEYASRFPILWTSQLVGGIVELGLATLFALGIVAQVKGADDDAKAKRVRRWSILQAVAGVIAIAAGIASVAVWMGFAAP
jgi:hypothetical protein